MMNNYTNRCAAEVGTVKSALVAKLVNGKILIEEAKRNLEEKADVIHMIEDQLQYLSMGFPASFIKAEPNLVNLLEEESITETDNHNDAKDNVPPFEILSKWIRVYKDKWIFGFDLECNCKLASEANIQLIVSSPKSPITNTSRVFSIEVITHKDIKRTQGKYADKSSRLAVVTVIDNDAFFGESTGKITLNTSLAVNTQIQDERRTLNSKVFMDLGDFVCEPTFLLQTNHRVNIDNPDPSHDLLALKMLTCKYQLNITSETTDLSQFHAIMVKTTAFTYHPQSRTLLANRTHPDTEPLDIAWLTVSEKINAHHLKVDFHTSTNSQLLLLVHLLYKILPKDVVLLLRSDEEDFCKPSVGKVMQHLMKEVDFICESFISRQSAQFEQFAQIASSDVEALQAKVAREREDFKKATQGDVAVCADKYSHFSREMWKMQLATNQCLSELMDS